MSERDELGTEEAAFIRAMNRGPSPRGWWKKLLRDVGWFAAACVWLRGGMFLAGRFGFEMTTPVCIVLYLPALVTSLRLF